MEIVAAIEEGADAFLVFTVMVIAIFIALVVTISR
jgi:hypothetical protein